LIGLFQGRCGEIAPGDIQPAGAGVQEEKEFMGDSFGLVSTVMPNGRIKARTSGSFLSIKQFSILAVGLAAAMIFPAAKVGAQSTTAAKPETETDIKYIQAPGAAQAGAPTTITLADAMERARKLDPTLVGAMSDAKSAREDRLQARNAMLPQLTGTSQYLNTQGDGGRISDGRFVTNDGVHIYREWIVFHQDLSPSLLMGTPLTRAKAAEALANAKSEIARRGLTVTVTKTYYALVVAQRKFAAAQAGLDQAKHFLDITQNLEHQGQAPHSDAVKAEIAYRIQKQAYDEARFTMEDTRLGLSVILFPDFNQNFTVVDDLDTPPALPPFAEVQQLAEKQNPDMRVAMETAREAELDVKLAKAAFLPTITVEADNGIEANCFALHCTRSSIKEVGVVPNLGYFLTASLTIPVWDWGTLRSKVHQAEYKEESAKATLTQAQRTAISELYATYDEAMVARAGLEEAQKTAELAAEGLRLTSLRYEGGASLASEVVDSETTLVTARNAYADALVRYRTLLATLQTFTGSF
jgi:outer membrane protein TolC